MNVAEVQLKAETKADALDTQEVNESAKIFMDGYPRAVALAKNMKAGSLGRVFAAMMEFPLGDKYPKFLSKAENELFIMSMSLLMAKNKMFEAVSKNQEAMKKLEDELIKTVDETSTEAKGEMV